MPAEIKLFTDLKDACVDIVGALPSMNDTQRKQMRDILLQLKGDLSDSLVLAEQYLTGVRRSTREADILDLLFDAPMKLLAVYNEFKICAALYHLRDQFDQWFSKVKGSVNVANLRSVKKLVSRIADGERYVICELEEVLRELPRFAKQIEDATDDADKEATVQNLHKFINDSLAALRSAESQTKRAIGAVIALM